MVEDEVQRIAGKYLGKCKYSGKELCIEYCPFCHGGEHHDKNTFFINRETGLYKCQRGKCSAEGNLESLKKHLGEEKMFTKPKVDVYEPTTIEHYWGTRKISRQTLFEMKVAEKEESTVFQYFKNGEIVMIKYRKETPEGKKCWAEKNGLHVLWNMNNINTDQPVVIVEGEPDAMSVWQAGYQNVVSVPNGANDMTWVDNCQDFIARIKSFIIYVDNDKAGESLKEQIIDRLGPGRCKVVKHEGKDANEDLLKLGSEYILKVIENAELINVADLVYFSDVKKPTKSTTVPTGLITLDEALHEFALGELTIWTGKTSSGKSTILNQAILKAVETGYKAFIYTGELTVPKIKAWIMRSAAGRNNLEKSGYEYIPTEWAAEKIIRWISHNIVFFDRTLFDAMRSKITECDYLLKRMEYAFYRDNCRIFSIDNIMTATLGNLSNKEYYQDQVSFMGKLLEFANKHESHIHLVIHQGKGDSGIENVSGMSQLSNLAHNALLVTRIDEMNKLRKEDEDAWVDVLKSRESGSRLKILLHFDNIGKRFFGKHDNADYQYPWNNIDAQGELPF